jgi:hypothetical protein
LRCWPWVVACAAAGLSRVPLWIRWGGLVAPEFQGSHSIGFELDSLTYLAAALVPWTAVFLFAVVARAGSKRAAVFVGAGAALGLLLVLLAQPSLAEAASFDPLGRFFGFVGTAAREVTDSDALQHAMIGAFALVGAGSLAALAAIGWTGPPSDPRVMITRLAVLTLALGCAMYVVSTGYVFDRYLLGWAVLLSIIWVAVLPRAVRALHALILPFHTGRLLLKPARPSARSPVTRDTHGQHLGRRIP